MNINKYLAYATKIITWLNLRKVLLLALMAFAALALYTTYEQRARLFGPAPLTRPPAFALSPDLQDNIKLLVSKNPIIASILVLSADLGLNQRVIIFRFSDDPVLNEIYDKRRFEHGDTKPIFNQDAVNNSEMVSVINGEFTCNPTSPTNVIMPGVERRVPVVCRISLPPYYGQFSGYLSVVLTRVPSLAEKLEIELETKRLANDIFFKSLVHY